MTAPVPTSPLISAEALRTLLAQSPAPVIVDCSFDLADTDAGERGYRAGHLPGARYAHLERDLSGPKTGADGRFLGRHPLRERADYAALMARWGIAPGTPVVVYDRQGAMFAARLWWTLRWMGHADVRVLDGGVAAWEAAGEPLEAGDGPADQALPPYPAQPPRMPTVQAEPLRDRLAAARVIDARAPARATASSRTTCSPTAASSRRTNCAPNSPPPSTAAPSTASSTNAARAPPPATTCWRWRWPGSRRRRCTRAPGASGRPGATISPRKRPRRHRAVGG